jgi:hypothetical protein
MHRALVTAIMVVGTLVLTNTVPALADHHCDQFGRTNHCHAQWTNRTSSCVCR